MKNPRQFFVFVAIMIIISIFFIVKEQSIKNKSSKDYFLPSSKELNEKGEFIEHLDSATLLYSNFKYNFSVDFPDNWLLDKGVSEHTIIRGSQKDSAISFAVNVITLNEPTFVEKNIWDLWDIKELSMEENNKEMLMKIFQTSLLKYSSRRIHISNKKAIETSFSYIVKDVDFEFEIQCFFYSIYQSPYTYTIGLQVPYDFYIETPDKYKYFINNFVLFTK